MPNGFRAAAKSCFLANNSIKKALFQGLVPPQNIHICLFKQAFKYKL